MTTALKEKTVADASVERASGSPLLDADAARREFEEQVSDLRLKVAELVRQAEEPVPLADAQRRLLESGVEAARNSDALSEAMLGLIAEQEVGLTVDQQLVPCRVPV
jgi:hypothetical protein